MSFSYDSLVSDVLDRRMSISSFDNTELDDGLFSFALYFVENILDESMQLQSPNPNSETVINLGTILDDDAWIRLAELISANEARPNMQSASKNSIEGLDKVKIGDQESSLMCNVCSDEILLGSVATRMPCSHIYHQNCIVEWLVRSNMCPLCRYKMPTS